MSIPLIWSPKARGGAHAAAHQPDALVGVWGGGQGFLDGAQDTMAKENLTQAIVPEHLEAHVLATVAELMGPKIPLKSYRRL